MPQNPAAFSIHKKEELMYRIETHLHTTYISHCGWLGAQAIMKYYSACGL